MEGWSLRPLDASDADRRFLGAMLYEAVAWRRRPRRPPEELLGDPQVARYAAGWPRAGDFGLAATTDSGERLGAAWYRLFDRVEPGFGFAAPDVPELSLAVRPTARGRGIGTALIAALAEQARAEGRPALSLSVEPDNLPALRIYRKAGFREVGTIGEAVTLRLDLG